MAGALSIHPSITRNKRSEPGRACFICLKALWPDFRLRAEFAIDLMLDSRLGFWRVADVQRAGTSTLWFFGDDETSLCRYGNIRDDTYRSNTGNTLGVRCDDGNYQKAPRGSYQANGFGLHDLIGNVYEWAQDCWNDSYKGAPGDGSAWMSGDCDPPSAEISKAETAATISAFVWRGGLGSRPIKNVEYC